MRLQLLWTIATAGFLLSSLGGCGDTGNADKLFSPANGDGTGGTSVGGTGGTSDGGSGGTSDGGSGGTSDGGSGGTSVGGTGGTSVGGSGGTSVGGSGGTSVGGSGGTAGSGGTGMGGMGATGGAGGTSGMGGTDPGGSGGTGGATGPGGDIPCPSYPFDATVCALPEEVCCLSFNNPYQGECVGPADVPSCDTAVNCAGPADCPPGTQCCGELLAYGSTSRYEHVTCRPNCAGPADVVFCDPYDEYQTCPDGTSCENSSILPEGYWICRD